MQQGDRNKRSRANKFNAKKCSVGELTFDSKKEKARYFELKAMESQGIIKNLVVHPRWPLVMRDGTPILIRGAKKNTTARYTADFQYEHATKGEVIEDVKTKATMTEASKLRIAVFEAIYGVEVSYV